MLNNEATESGAAPAEDVESVVPRYLKCEAQHQSFIFNSWLKSLQSNYSLVPKHRYFESVKRIIAKVAETSSVLMAVDDADPGYVLGYAIADPEVPGSGEIVVHYAYTKRAFRRMGLQKELVKRLGFRHGLTIIAPFPTFYTREIVRHTRHRIQPDNFHYAKWI